MNRLIDIKVIVDGLRGRIDELVAELLPAGRRDGQEWRCGSVAGDEGKSMAVHLRGPKVGVWCDFSTGETGDALDLVSAVLCRGDKTAAIKWAKSWLHLDSVDHKTLAVHRQQAVKRKHEAEVAGADEVAKRRRQAFQLWLSGSETIEATPAQAYLEGRGIEFDQLGRFPRSLRFGRLVYHREGGQWPALLAAIGGPDGKFAAVHRTYLTRGPNGWVKAPVDNPKMTLGQFAGGCIHLWRPMIDGKPGPRLAEAGKDARALICEGIEDGLSLAMNAPDHYVLVAVSVSNMARLVLPPAIRNVTICADNDAPGSEAHVAVVRAADWLLGQGREVSIARPPEGVKDFNDMKLPMPAGTSSGAA